MKLTCVLLLALTSGVALAQPPAGRLDCNGLPPDTACTVQEAPVPFAGSLAADTGGNGGITVQPWDGAGVWLRWKIETNARSLGEAWELIPQVHVEISDGQVRVSGPRHSSRQGWSVNYEIYVPRQADLSLTTLNGAIDITGVQGKLRFTTLNGAIKLRDISGDVSGETVNGALWVSLSGDRWEGPGLDVETVNGAVSVTIPPSYSAHFELSNVVGQLDTNLPVTDRKVGYLGHRATFDSGAGGAPIRLSTVNGSLMLNAAVPTPQ